MCAALYIPEALNAPDLMMVNKKPTSNVRIDWDNPLTKGLKFYGMFKDGILFDLVSGRHWVTGNARQLNEHGEGVDTSVPLSNLSNMDIPTLNQGAEFSCFVDMEQTRQWGSTHIFLSFGNITSALLQFTSSYDAAEIRFSVTNNQARAMAMTMPIKTRMQGVFGYRNVFAESPQVQFWGAVNGTNRYYSTNTSPGTYTENKVFNILNLGTSFTAPTQTGYANVRCFGYYEGRRLSDEDSLKLSANLYQILVPA